MNQSLQPPTQLGDARSPEDEIDGLLRAYFRAEMPHPWPTFQAPVPLQEARPLRRFSLMRSRLALAASVALIILGSLFLARMPQDSRLGDLPALSSPDAKRIKVKEYLILKPDGSTE